MIIFDEVAPLRDEFNDLYSSLFKNAPIYMKIVGVLAKKKIGMTRSEIADATGITKSGQLSDALDTLSESGFVRSYRFFGKTKRNRTYQLIDNFTLFHFRFLDGTTTDVDSTTRGWGMVMPCISRLSTLQPSVYKCGIAMKTDATEVISVMH